MIPNLFSEPQPTVEQAVRLHEDILFNPAAVFQTDQGYVYCRLHTMAPADACGEIARLTGYTLVAHCDAVLGVWRMEEKQ